MAAVWVEIDSRKFLVNFDTQGEPLRIYERKTYGEGLFSGWWNAPYWHAKHHELGKGNTLPKRIIEAAKAKHAAS